MEVSNKNIRRWSYHWNSLSDVMADVFGENHGRFEESETVFGRSDGVDVERTRSCAQLEDAHT